LQPGGIVRLVVPDAGMYLRFYCEPGWQALVAARPLVKEGELYRDTWIGERYATKMEMINAVFRQSGKHRYAYDAETLLLTLRDHGKARHADTDQAKPPAAWRIARASTARWRHDRKDNSWRIHGPSKSVSSSPP
jgi:hypothetical protein